jgi:hypothetical protein
VCCSYDLQEVEVVKINAPSPDSFALSARFYSHKRCSDCTDNYYDRYSVRQRKVETESIELGLDGRVTVHCDSPSPAVVGSKTGQTGPETSVCLSNGYRPRLGNGLHPLNRRCDVD